MAADLAAGDGGKRRVDFPLFRGHDDAAFWRIYDLWRQEQFLVAQVFSCIFGWCAYLCRICSFNLVAGRSGGRGIWRVLDISGRVNLSGGGNDPTPIQGAPRAQSHLAWCWRSEEHMSELNSLMRLSDDAFFLNKKRS